MASFLSLGSLALCLLGLHLTTVAASSACDKSCTDYSRFCVEFREAGFMTSYASIISNKQVPEFKEHSMPPSADCNLLYYKTVCPQSCNICKACDMTEDVTTLNTKAQANKASLNTLADELATEKSSTAELERKADNFDAWLSSQKVVPDTDAQSFRLALRHSSNQLTLGQFEGLYRYGALPGTFDDTSGSYQFRDPDFHFFWDETSSVRLDIFDLAGDKTSSVHFQIPTPSPSSQTTWSKVFMNNCKYVKDSKQNTADYPGISNTCVYSNFLKGFAGSDRPSLALAKDDIGNCQNSKIFFMLQGGVNNKRCEWEVNYRAPSNIKNDKTIAYYSAIKDPVNAQVGLLMASRFELRISGAFASSVDSSNGYERVFRYPSFAGVDVTSYYENAIVDPNKDISSLTAKHVKTDEMYRSSSIQDQIKAAKKVMFVVYDIAGHVAEALTFQGTGDFKTWFGKENLISNLNWNFDGSYNFFSYAGDAGIGRRFYIQGAYGGCDRDPGYLLVACNKPNGDPPCTQYESMGDNSGDSRQYLCKIIYTDSNVKQKSIEHALGSAFEIFVK